MTVSRALISAEEARFYSRAGYLVKPNVLTAEELASLRQAVDEASATRYDVAHDGTGRDARYDAVFHQKVNLWQVHPGIRRHTFTPRIAEMARVLMGVRAVRLWHDQLLVKQPGQPTPTPFHQDLTYWPMEQDLAMTAWTALDDVDESNSCMQYIPGSHQWGVYDAVDFMSPQGVAEVAKGHEADCVAVSAPVPAGSVIFHHSLTFHGATANVTDRPRRAMIIHYQADGVTFNGRAHIVSDVAGLTKGEPIAGHGLWPILAEAA
ncbi:MAG TPA: phytanoyl-CoA dioxygenase family protein [Armatimonadota bacterium]|jgi:ectoine hydroxylase-related dioxygenase (phytanoyl-CoA dioxygenase family)